MTNLIGFGKNRDNLEFKGPCKLSMNFMSNYLYVEPKNEAFKLISASFEWNYVMKKNLLFVFAEYDFLDFCLEFKNEQTCKKILDYIYSGKKNKEITDSISIDESFIKLIFQKISDNPTLNSALIEVIATWHQLLDEEDKEKYSNLMKDYGIFDLILVAVENQAIQIIETNIVEEKRTRKRRFIQIKKEEKTEKEVAKKNKLSTFAEIILKTGFQLMHVSHTVRQILLIFTSEKKDSFHLFRKIVEPNGDKFKCINCEKKAIIDVDQNFEICVKMESKEHLCKQQKILLERCVNIKIIQKPDYEYFDNCPGKVKKKLVIFDSADRNQCYEYSSKNGHSWFECRGCYNKKIAFSQLSKAIIRNYGTEKEYVECINEHQCDTRKYSSEKYAPIYDYVLEPNFEIRKFTKNEKERQTLIVFHPFDRTKCYQYFYDSRINNCKKFICRRCQSLKKSVTASLNQNSENVQYIILSNVKHVCEMKPLVSTEKYILYQHQDFEFIGETKTRNPKIFLFEKNDRKRGYIFFKDGGSYACKGCNSVNKNKRKNDSSNCEATVRGKLFRDKDIDQYSLQMKTNHKHSCEPQPYEPEKYESQINPKTSDFFYFRLKNGPKTLKLAIYSPDDKQFCFSFVFKQSHKSFVCIECKKIKKWYLIKLQKDADGKEYFNHDLKKHICEPIKVSSIPKSDILEESGIPIVAKPKKMIKIDESKVIKLPNFELRPDKLVYLKKN